MINLPKKLFTISIALILLTACEIKPNLSCADQEVKETALELVTSQFKDYLLVEEYLYYNIAGFQSFISEQAAIGERVSINQIDYVFLKKMSVDNQSALALIAPVDEKLLKMAPELGNVRKNGEDKALQKISCVADVNFWFKDSRRVKKLNYTAQYNEDGRIYVEAQDLFLQK